MRSSAATWRMLERGHRSVTALAFATHQRATPWLKQHGGCRGQSGKLADVCNGGVGVRGCLGVPSETACELRRAATNEVSTCPQRDGAPDFSHPEVQSEQSAGLVWSHLTGTESKTEYGAQWRVRRYIDHGSLPPGLGPDRGGSRRVAYGYQPLNPNFMTRGL